jgi:hypothetical protein
MLTFLCASKLSGFFVDAVVHTIKAVQTNLTNNMSNLHCALVEKPDVVLD